MTITLNGERVDIHDAETIADLVERHGLPQQSIFVEHNNIAVHRHEWPHRQLTQDDRVEFVRVVAGG